MDSLIWADVEQFLRNPGEVLARLRERLSMGDGERQRLEKELANIKARLADKDAERERVLALYRRGRIDDATLDQQLGQVDREKGALESEIRACIPRLLSDFAACICAVRAAAGGLRFVLTAASESRNGVAAMGAPPQS